MIVFQRILWLLLVAELVVGGIAISQRMSRPDPPQPDLSGLDSMTAADLQDATRRAALGDAEDWRALAEAWLGQGYYVEAEQCYRVARDLGPQNQQSVYGLGFCLERVGQLDEAISVLQQASEMSEDELSRTCRYQIGRCYLRMEKPAAAEQAFRECGELPAAAFQLAKLLIRTGRAADAVPTLDEHLARTPNLRRFVQLRALAAEELGDEQTAREYRDREQRAAPGPEVDYGMSFVTLFRSRYGLDRQLVACSRSDLASSPSQRSACLDRVLAVIREEDLIQLNAVYVEAVKARLALQQPDRALELLNELRRTKNEDPWTAELRGDALWLSGEEEQAVAAWARCIAMWPSATAHLKLAEYYERSGNPDTAAGHRGMWHQLRGLQAFRDNQIEEAHAQFRRAVDVVPDEARNWYYLAETLRLRGEILQARAAYNRCLELDPDYQRARNALAGRDGSSRALRSTTRR